MMGGAFRIPVGYGLENILGPAGEEGYDISWWSFLTEKDSLFQKWIII